jgi:hypothetical protein
MKRLLIIAILLCNAVVAQNLPKSIDVYFPRFIESHKYSDVSLEDAVINSDSISYETTDCHYVLDFKNMECRVYFKNELTGKAPIESVKYVVPEYKTDFDVWEYIIKLQDSADDTEIRISIETNSFLYTYTFGSDEFYDRTITFPTNPTIIVIE